MKRIPPATEPTTTARTSTRRRRRNPWFRPEGRSFRARAGSATVMSIGLSVIYILWTIRAGYLIASLVSTMPAWRLVDPLPILETFDDALKRRRRGTADGTDDDDESLESLAEGTGEATPAR